MLPLGRSFTRLTVYLDGDAQAGQACGVILDPVSDMFQRKVFDRYGLYGPDLVRAIDANFTKLAFLESLHVEDDFRGQGNGNRLLADFHRDALDCRVQGVVLLSDREEPQAEGFVLRAWYERRGYRPLMENDKGTLMLLPFGPTEFRFEDFLT